MCWNFQRAFNIVFNQHYRFQHTLKFSTRFSTCFWHSFQHALQISTCAEFFNMLFQDVFNTFQTWNSPMVWNMLKTVLKTMSNISKCVENHVENFKACWKPCQKYQSVSKITLTWPLHDPVHQFCNIKAVIKIKSDIINEDYRSLWSYMWSLIEILCGLEEKIGPVCIQLLHNVHAMENFWSQPCCELTLFSIKLSKLFRYFY